MSDFRRPMPAVPRWRAMITPVMRHFRRRRMREFQALLGVQRQSRVLDVGGTPLNWSLLDAPPAVVLLNLTAPEEPVPAGTLWVVADARALPFRDGAFDVAFSNSVIEHITEPEGQQAMASEMRRVGRGVYLQTPNRWFPIEPHLFTPFIHFLPRAIQCRLWRNFTLWGLVTRPTPADCEREVAGIRLLDARTVHRYLPDAEVRRERALGLTKSLIAVRRG